MAKTRKSSESQALSDAKDQLHKWIINEKKCVTVPYLSRNTQIKSSEAVKLMQEFYKENGDKGLSASYAILAQTDSKDPSKKGFLCKKVVLVQEHELDLVRSTFDHVHSTNIYSIQSNPIDDLKLLTNIDWDDVPHEEKQLARLKERSMSRETSMEPSSSTPAQKSVIQVDKNRKIDAMFSAGRAKKASPKKTSPKKTPKKSPFKKETEKAATSPKKRTPKIIIDGEDDIDDDVKPAPISPVPLKKTPVKDGKNFSEFINQSNDLFCTEESPEKVPIDFMDTSEPAEHKKGKNQNKKASTRKLKSGEKDNEVMEVDKAPPKSSRIPVDVDDDDVIEPRRVIRHAKVPETFVDEDGFLVTSQVNKAIETDEIVVPTKRPVLQPKPANITNEKKKTAASQAVSQGQSKISSFFGKK